MSWSNFMAEWHDWLRLAVLLSSGVGFILLLKRYIQNRSRWNTKTKDLWYGLFMWSVAGISIGIEGLFRESIMSSRLMFVVAASIVTLKGVLTKGNWGDTKY